MCLSTLSNMFLMRSMRAMLSKRGGQHVGNLTLRSMYPFQPSIARSSVAPSACWNLERNRRGSLSRSIRKFGRCYDGMKVVLLTTCQRRIGQQSMDVV